jgi:hypothetical protein
MHKTLVNILGWPRTAYEFGRKQMDDTWNVYITFDSTS